MYTLSLGFEEFWGFAAGTLTWKRTWIRTNLKKNRQNFKFCLKSCFEYFWNIRFTPRLIEHDHSSSCLTHCNILESFISKWNRKKIPKTSRLLHSTKLKNRISIIWTWLFLSRINWGSSSRWSFGLDGHLVQILGGV